jgi:mannose-6-phosphate isomerase-like protein (cupin superfamily)
MARPQGSSRPQSVADTPVRSTPQRAQPTRRYTLVQRVQDRHTGSDARHDHELYTEDAYAHAFDLTSNLVTGCGLIMHLHHVQEEALTVREGQLGYQFQGEPEQLAGPGDTVVFPAGRPPPLGRW